MREPDLLRRLVVISVRNDDSNDIAIVAYNVVANLECGLVVFGQGNAETSSGRGSDLPATVTNRHSVTIG